eukprot:1141027-Amorphochlora_amoeboformis.AAC.1
MPLIANPSRTSNGTPVLDTDEKLRLEVEAHVDFGLLGVRSPWRTRRRCRVAFSTYAWFRVLGARSASEKLSPSHSPRRSPYPVIHRFGKDKKSKGTGTIYVTEKNIIWLHSEVRI